MWKFFASFSDEMIVFMPRIEDTFSMYMRMLLGMAAVFQMPAMVFFLARMGLITARWMIRQFKYAVLVIVVIAAVITPSSDVASQMIVAGPMVVLYFLSIAIAWMFGKKRSFGIGRSTASAGELLTTEGEHVLGFHFHHFLRAAVSQLHHAVLQALRADRQS